MSSGRDPVPARVLVVCTGNICRSPLAQGLLQAFLAGYGVDSSQVVVESAGVRALVGRAMTPQAERELSSLGGTAGSFAARQLAPWMIERADLVVTAERLHRAEVVRAVPRALRFSFTLLELRRLLAHADLQALPADPVARLRGLPYLASSRKGMSLPATPEADDIADPYRRSDAAYAATTRQVEPAVRLLAEAIANRG